MINVFPFGNLRKIWAVMWGSVFFLLVSIYLVVLATLCSGFLTHKVMLIVKCLCVRSSGLCKILSHQPLLWWPVCERHTRSTSIKIFRSSFILKNLKQVSCKGGIGGGGAHWILNFAAFSFITLSSFCILLFVCFWRNVSSFLKESEIVKDSLG